VGASPPADDFRVAAREHDIDAIAGVRTADRLVASCLVDGRVSIVSRVRSLMNPISPGLR
jgi:hypothetical protein